MSESIVKIGQLKNGSTNIKKVLNECDKKSIEVIFLLKGLTLSDAELVLNIAKDALRSVSVISPDCSLSLI